MLEEDKGCYVLLVFVCLRRCVCLIYELLGEAKAALEAMKLFDGCCWVTDKSRAFVKLYSCFSTQVECKTNSQMSAINCCTFLTKKMR